MQGAVVGINVAIVDASGKGSYSGVSFSVPMDSVRGLIDQIITYGRTIRPALGITLAPPQVGLSPARRTLCVHGACGGGGGTDY